MEGRAFSSVQDILSEKIMIRLSILITGPKLLN